MCKCRSHGTFPLFGLQSSHLNICYYHQDLHRRPLRPGSRPRFYSDRRALLLIEAWLLPRRPGIGRALQRHPFSGLVDSAGMLTLEPFSDDQGRSAVHPRGIPPISFLAPYGFNHPLTRTHVRLLGPCFKTGRMGSPQADARSTQMPRHAVKARHHLNPRRSTPRIDRRTGLLRSASDRDASPAPIRFPPDNFKHSLTLFSKSFSSLPRGTCSLSVSRPYLALDGIYRICSHRFTLSVSLDLAHITCSLSVSLPYLALDGIYRPIGAAFPNNPTRRQRLVVRQGPGTTGLSPSLAPLSRELGPGPSLRTLLQTTIRTPKTSDFQAGLFPVRSPLLRESLLVSFPPLIDMLKLSG
ncbi:unnamed protein product [Microthlaspi erraticum]|uniref:Protein TAR1 n=1 Tax=Microthlaspi erraticum TaxID=1685480 RepID=A0A6D2KW53_9BRAS|nr:unnamed protein product [Microthlaspi erraticum]